MSDFQSYSAQADIAMSLKRLAFVGVFKIFVFFSPTAMLNKS